MKNVIHVTILLLAISLNACSTPIANAKTETFKVWGNCDMCKKVIETAAFKKGEAKASWNSDSKLAELTFDSVKTNADAVLKRIAYAGYDNVNYLAPDDAYAKLPACCQYARAKKETVTAGVSKAEQAQPTSESKATYTCPMHPEVHSEKPGNCPKCGMTLVKGKAAETKQNMEAGAANKPAATTPTVNPLTAVYEIYFALKDALVKDNGALAAAKAGELYKAIEAVKMEALNTQQHSVWMKYADKLKYDAEHIKGVTDTEHQREHFAGLSNNLYQVVKVINPAYPVYYDHCPMYNDGKGANWLSKESGIKNPYYGAQMLTCGKTTETIK